MDQHLDELDLRIFVEVQKNGRVTYRTLGKKLDSNGTTMKVRIDRMLRAGAIKNFISLVDPRIFHYNIVFLLIPGFDINDDKFLANMAFNNIISLAGEPYYKISCIGQVSVRSLLMKGNNDVIERKIGVLKKNLPESCKVIGIIR